MSQSKFTTMAIEKISNIIKIDSQTAGANGNVSVINLPFGFITSFSGLGITFDDGTQTQRIGIVPYIEVQRILQYIHKGDVTILNFVIKFLIEQN